MPLPRAAREIFVAHLIERVGRIEPQHVRPRLPLLHARAHHPLVALDVAALHRVGHVEPLDGEVIEIARGIDGLHRDIGDIVLMAEAREGLRVERDQRERKTHDRKRRTDGEMRGRASAASARSMADPANKQDESENGRRDRRDNPIPFGRRYLQRRELPARTQH